MKYLAKYICGDSDDDKGVIGEFNTEDEAICACCNFAASEEEEFGNEEDICKESLKSRHYYCVGYSTLCLEIEIK